MAVAVAAVAIGTEVVGGRPEIVIGIRNSVIEVGVRNIVIEEGIHKNVVGVVEMGT